MKFLLILSILFIFSCAEQEGCTIEIACNFDSSAESDDGSCSYPEQNYDCHGACINDDDSDGICNELEIEGCMDQTACNFNDLATDNSNCLYVEEDCMLDETTPPNDDETTPPNNGLPDEIDISSVEYIWDSVPQYIIEWEESTIDNFEEYKILWVNNWNGHGEKDTIITITDQSITSHTINIYGQFSSFNGNPQYNFDIDETTCLENGLSWISEGACIEMSYIGMPPTDRNWFWVNVINDSGDTSQGEGMHNETIGAPVVILAPVIIEEGSFSFSWAPIGTILGDVTYTLWESTSESMSYKTRYWYTGNSGQDTSITISIPPPGSEFNDRMFYQIEGIAPFGQEFETNIQPAYTRVCNDGEVSMFGFCYSIATTTSIHFCETCWSWLDAPRGEIPPEIGQLVNLNELIIQHSTLEGGLPSEIGNLVNLTHLELWNTHLTGPLPSEIGSLVNLETLILMGNDFTGELPSEMGNMTNLTHVELWENQLTGEIPSGIGNCINLEVLGLSGNSLSGPIPEGIGNLVNLEVLGLSDNKLTGSIPAGIGNLVNLSSQWGHVADLDLSANELSGPIPPEIGLMQNITKLDLSHNKLSGGIPPEFGNMINLTKLYLENNELTDQIPSEIGYLTSLEELTLANNQISGPIPDEFGNLTNLVEFTLNNNNLSGQIPSEIQNLTQITSLDLSHNQLTGAVPSEIGDMFFLESLYLQHNLLTSLPENICSLNFDFWHRFDARYNNICPPWPSCVGCCQDEQNEDLNCEEEMIDEYECTNDSDNDFICDVDDICPNDPNNDIDNDGVCENDEILGCMLETACNYNENATELDECLFQDLSLIEGQCCLISEFDDCGLCGENFADEDGFITGPDTDCEGDCFGAAVEDTDGNCCNEIDCNGDCWGNASLDIYGECCDGHGPGEGDMDDCGVCNGESYFENENDFGGIYDCFGKCGGAAQLDDCGICEGGNEDKDCQGICFGNTILDDCGICGGLNYPYSCWDGDCPEMDCNGECTIDSPESCEGINCGTASVDNCDVCSGGTTGYPANSGMDCHGDCGGEAFLDDCGICSDGSTNHEPNSDMDCADECFGNAMEDCDGECNGPGIPDGFGDCCSSGSVDECGHCDGPNMNCNSSNWIFGCPDMDCDGVCGGTNGPGWCDDGTEGCDCP